MTREEFVAEKKAAERRIVLRVVPFGIIYAIYFAMILAIPCLIILLCMYYSSDARSTLVWELCSCIILTITAVLAGRDSNRRFAELAFKCPFCRGFLVFSSGDVTVTTGKCFYCERQIFSE